MSEIMLGVTFVLALCFVVSAIGLAVAAAQLLIEITKDWRQR